MIKEPPATIDYAFHYINIYDENGAELMDCITGGLLPKKIGQVSTITGHTKEDSEDLIKSVYKQIRFADLHVETGHKVNNDEVVEP